MVQQLNYFPLNIKKTRDWRALPLGEDRGVVAPITPKISFLCHVEFVSS